MEGDEGTRDAPDGAATTPAEPIRVSDLEHLNDLVASHHLVLVDFHADWCGPCKMLEPTVAALARESAAAVAKVDVDAHGSLAGRYDVRGVPTLVLFADGRPVERVVGVRDRDALGALIDRYAA